MFSLPSQCLTFRVFCFIEMTWGKAPKEGWIQLVKDDALWSGTETKVWAITVFYKDGLLLAWHCLAGLQYLDWSAPNYSPVHQLLCNAKSSSPLHKHDLQKSKCLWNKDRWLSVAIICVCFAQIELSWNQQLIYIRFTACHWLLDVFLSVQFIKH